MPVRPSGGVVVVLVLLVVSFSGCVLWGTNTANDEKTEVVNLDALRIAREGIKLSSDEVRAGSLFRVYMTVDNVGATPVNLYVGDKGTGVLYHYNTFLYTIEGFRTYPSQPDNGFVEVKPGRSQVFEWTIRAPSEDRFTQRINEETLKFHLNYTGIARTNRQIYFIKPWMLMLQDYMGTRVSVPENNVAEPGPLVLEFRIPQGEPVAVETGKTATLEFYMHNEGDGLVYVKNVKLVTPLSPSSNCDFGGSGGELEVKDELKDKLEFYGKIAPIILKCEINNPNVDFIKSYRFSIEAEYNYITNEREVKLRTVKEAWE